MPKSKREKVESISKYERQKLQSLYTHSGAAYGSVRNSVNASNLPLSKLRQLYIQNLPIGILFLPRVISKERRHLPNSKKMMYGRGIC